MSHATDELITANEAARILNISPRTVKTYRDQGKFAGYHRYSEQKILYRKADILKFRDESYQKSSNFIA
jgi:DNA-binding transcriptional MerR regulator